LPGSVDDLHRLARREFGRLKRHPEMIGLRRKFAAGARR
jgi:hypothetical protein